MGRGYILVLTIGLSLILSACITDFGPKEKNVELQPEVSQTFQANTNDPEAKLVWYLDGEQVSDGTTQYTFTAEQLSAGKTMTHQLVVREENSSVQSFFRFIGLPEDFAPFKIWTIKVVATVDQPTCYLDEDGDTYGDITKVVQSDDPPENCVDDGMDCNDTDPAINPGMEEIQNNGKDDDCNAQTPDSIEVADDDQDGFDADSDCDDGDPDVNPGMEESPYNGKDDDCNAQTPDDDIDADGYTQSEECNDTDPAINPGAAEVAYNGQDDDCNDQTPDDDLDNDTFNEAQDCNDNDPAVNPGAEETPYNGKDDDCNAQTPDDDLDADGYLAADDCDDNSAAVNPGAEDACNGIDDNCDGKVDDGCVDSEELAQEGLNLLIDHLQAYLISGATPSSVEDIVPHSTIEEIRDDYFQTALNQRSDSPSAHFGLAILELVQIAYDIDSVAVIDFMLDMLSGTTGETDMGALAAMLFEILDSTAGDYLNNALEHMEAAANLDTEILLQLYLPVAVTDASGSPVIDPETGLPEIEKDDDGNIVFESEKSIYELDLTDIRLVRALLNAGVGALHLYRAYDLNIADVNGTYDYFSEIKEDEATGKVDLKSLNSFMLALEYNDRRAGFLTMKSGGAMEAQGSKEAFLAALTDALAALDELAEETDDQSDDLVTEERMVNIYDTLVTILSKFSDVAPPEFSLTNLRDIFDRLNLLVKSTTADRYPVELEMADGNNIDLAIDLSGLFSGSVINLHQYLPYHYWFTITEETAYPANMLTVTKNTIRRVMSKLFDVRLPIPLNDDYPDSQLEGLPLVGRLNDLTSGLIGYSTINIERLLAPTITVVFPDLSFGGIVQNLTQQEVDTVVMSFSSTIFNQEE